MKSALWLAVLVVAIVLLTRLLWPRTVEVSGPPLITTVWDTVPVLERHLDTLWRERVIREVGATRTLVETVTVQLPPDTVVLGTATVAVQAIQVGATIGAVTTVEGVTLAYDSTRMLLRRPWRASYWTAGPLRAVVGDTVPPLVTFYPPPPPPCRFLCKSGLVLGGVATGLALAAIGRFP